MNPTKRLASAFALLALALVAACGGDATGPKGGMAMTATAEIRMVMGWFDDVLSPQLFVTLENTGSKDADMVFAEVVFLQGNRVVESGLANGGRLAAGRSQEYPVYLMTYDALDGFAYDCYEITVMAGTNGSMKTYQKTFPKVCK